MVHSEVYLNNVISIAPFSTPACPDCSQNIQKTALYAVFAFQFFIHFPGGSADPICHYVWSTPMPAYAAAPLLQSAGACCRLISHAREAISSKPADRWDRQTYGGRSTV